MEEPERLTPCNSGRRRSSDSIHSPEFEFWMVRNPSFPQPNQLSADELFSHGVLLPLDLLQCPTTDDPSEPNGSNAPFFNKTEPEPSGSGRPETESGVEPSAAIVNSAAGGGSFTSSKRWKDIFKKTEKKDSGVSNEENCREKKKEKRKEKKLVGGSNGVTGAELNINIWPFSRSRSAGNGASRPRVAGGSGLTTRKVSSAPCSRSNSAGESKSRKWPSSPSRGGVHLGRSSPVWQVRRNIAPGSSSRSSDNPVKTTEKSQSNIKKVVKKDGVEGRRKVTSSVAGGGPKARVLNLNVPTCIGYRNQLGCRSDENSAINIAAAGVGGDQSGTSTVTGDGVRGSNIFNIKSLFTKKVY
ncbi:putative UBA and UBX domain-containing protein-like [Capsicum annuum]|uniref:uncharacterized protein LOC107859630 n=1 Tax=Capsicum annuum TaxID=4072 RepID=UPI001FB0D76F|nr:uncharacterized protein LOC107859630 [Capsicum annuum]KAF3651617.1 putative UBA and UBX domain-containing protein-like [Capsicum annuum]